MEVWPFSDLAISTDSSFYSSHNEARTKLRCPRYALLGSG